MATAKSLICLMTGTEKFEMFDILAVLLALGLLIYLAYRGISLLILAPLMALLAALLTWDLPILAAYTKVFMTNAGDFIIAFFPLFLLGSIFGKLMDDSGCAKSIARSVSAWLGPERAIVSVVLCCAVLTYGGCRRSSSPSPFIPSPPPFSAARIFLSG
jgi:H+/gluconate symporter-like permease